MSGRYAARRSINLAFKRQASSQAPGRQSSHTRLTGQPTFVKGQKEEEGSLAPVYISVGTALVATVAVGTLLYNTYKNKAIIHGLRPDQYSSFDVLSARKTPSPSQSDSGNDEYVHLSVVAPMSSEVIREGRSSAMTNNLRILSVFMKEPSLQIERPYTPLYSDALDGMHANTPIEFLIKRYPDGELGNYAHKLHAGSKVELRGPTVTWQGSQPDHFILIVGGTGITPAYQLLNTALSKHAQASNMLSKSLPRFTILYGATKPSSFLLLPELAALKKDFPEQIDIHLQVDRLDKSTASSTSWLEWVRGDTPTLEGLDLRVGRIDEKAVKRALESSDKDTEASRRILVCGPEKMIASVAGSKQGKMQGKLGGLLADLNCTEEEVFKL